MTSTSTTDWWESGSFTILSWASFIFVFLLVPTLSVFPSPVCRSKGWHAFSLSFFFSSSVFSFLSLWLSRVGGAIVCLWLVYEEHWFTQWGLACLYGEGGEKYEWIYNAPTLHFSPLFPNSPIIFLPLYMLLSHLQAHFSTGVCACVSESVFV